MSWWLLLGLVVGIVTLMAGAGFGKIRVVLLGACILLVTICAELLFVVDTSDHQHALRVTYVTREVRAPCVARVYDAPARVVLPACADLHALSAQRDRRDV
jgi:hypothetical protein